MKKLSDKEILEEMELENTRQRHEMWNPNSPDWFENFCSACDHIGTDECPFGIQENEYGYDTRWKDLGCKNFWD